MPVIRHYGLCIYHDRDYLLKVKRLVCVFGLCRDQGLQLLLDKLTPLSCRVGFLGAEPGWEGYLIRAAIQWLRKNSRLPSTQNSYVPYYSCYRIYNLTCT